MELQAIVDGVNIAKGKNITGTVEDVAGYEYEKVVDGNLDSYAASSTASPPGNTCVTVDLGKEYNLDEIMVLHARWRVSYDNVTSVSSDNRNWKVVLNEITPEMHDAKRINAYTDTYNGYVQDNLVLWFDGYLNSEAGANNTYGHNTLSTTWKDLSGNNNDVTVSGATWYNNYLSFDGVDDWAYKTSGAVYNIDKEHTIEVLLKPRKVASSHQSIFNTVNTGTGVLQYGSLWINTYNQILFKISDGTTNAISQYLTSSNTDITGKYFLATQVRDDRHYRLYNKATYVTSGSIAWDAGTPNPAIYIGGSAYYFQGKIYSIRVYNKALTEDEILHNYNYDKEKFIIE